MRCVLVNRFYYPDYSGTAQMTTDLAVYLSSLGHEVRVITSDQRIDDARARLPARESIDGVQVERLRTSRLGRGSLARRAVDYLSFLVGAAWRVLIVCRPGDRVVVQTDPPMLGTLVGPAARLRRAEVVNWVHDLYPELAERLGVPGIRGAVAAILRWLRNASLRAARMNVVVGENLAETLRAQEVPADRMRVVPNWSPGDAVRPLPREGHPLRARWGLEGCFVVGYSGNAGLAHEFDAVLDAAARLAARPDIRFLFVGGGARRPWLEAEVARRGLGGFLFLPYLDAAERGLGLTAADVHLVSLRPDLEGLLMPAKYFGIAAAGRATLFLGAPDAEVARLIGAEGGGLVVDPSDGAGLAAAIVDLADDPERCLALGREARVAHERRFSREHPLAAWAALL
jgi:glycosyltransferase involved in cell wall biosynthesis